MPYFSFAQKRPYVWQSFKINIDYNRTHCSPKFYDSLGENVTLSPTLEEEENTTSNHRAFIDDAASYPSQIHLIDINGTLLPMEQKPGETKYSIPGFVLSDTANKPLQ